MIEIQNGCVCIGQGPILASWEYLDAKSMGILRTTFTAPIGIIPKIGDFINEDNFTWVARTEYKIVPDLVQPDPDDDYVYRR